jgi:AcrR family transcriptional regulator
MGRKPRFSNDQFIDAAMTLAVQGGPGAVTVSSLARLINAPVGSVYHRFSSREVIIAELWLRTAEMFQHGFIELLAKGDAVRAALHTSRWVRRHPAESRILLLYRKEELISGSWPDEVKARAEALESELARELVAFTRRVFGSAGKKNLHRTVYALIDVPLAAVRRYLEAGEMPPGFVDTLIKETCKTVMGEMS